MDGIGGTRKISSEQADAIMWNLPRGKRGNRKDSDEIVDQACEMLLRGETVVIEEPVNEPVHFSAYQRVGLIRSRLGSGIQSTSLTDIEAEGLRVSSDSELIPRYAIRLRPNVILG
ncbi:hypothetical protein HYV64_01655 [Candidatus Shapirobacteria bacterium]|nr:hypothetical protein [Candidatus Shapirobacteria bacterium]